MWLLIFEAIHEKFPVGTHAALLKLSGGRLPQVTAPRLWMSISRHCQAAQSAQYPRYNHRCLDHQLAN